VGAQQVDNFGLAQIQDVELMGMGVCISRRATVQAELQVAVMGDLGLGR
jgi:hypothetical protein